MSVQLYKPGNTHTVNGVQCELKNFDIVELEGQLKEGWYRVPGEWDEIEDQTPDDESSEEFAKSDPNHPVRVAAKEAGIEGWDTKRIATLESQLNGAEE